MFYLNLWYKKEMERETLSLILPEGIFDYVRFIKDYPETKIINNSDQAPTVVFTNVFLPEQPKGNWTLYTREQLAQNINFYKHQLPNTVAALLNVLKTSMSLDTVDPDLVNMQWTAYNKEVQSLHVTYTNILLQYVLEQPEE
jgi:hypothetical protein